MGKIESRLMEMGKGSRERSDSSSKESKSAPPEEMPRERPGREARGWPGGLVLLQNAMRTLTK